MIGFYIKCISRLNWLICVVLSVTLNRHLETGLHLKNFWKLIIFGLKGKDPGMLSHWDRIGVRSFSMYAKVSKKLTSLSLWHAYVFVFNWMLEHNRVRNLFILLLLLRFYCWLALLVLLWISTLFLLFTINFRGRYHGVRIFIEWLRWICLFTRTL